MNTDDSTPTPNLKDYRVVGYSPGGNGFKRALWYGVNVLIFKSSWLPLYAIKRAILRLFGAHIGPGVVIKPGVNIKYPWRLRIDAYSWIGEGVCIDNLAEVHIGAHCCISQQAYLLTGNHDYRRVDFALMTASIVLEDGAWVGARATVCPGIRMRRNAILTVGSVLTRDTEPNGIYVGNPATFAKLRNLTDTPV